MSLHMKSRITQPPVTETPVDDWRKDIALEHLRLERAAAEDRRTETVARLAIELVRAKGGRTKIVPDVAGAVRLLAESEAARRTPVRKEPAEDLLAPHLENSSPTLRWHIAKRGEEPGSGGVVSARILCDKGRPLDFKIHVGFTKDSRWHEIGKWEVLRNEGIFRQFIEAALTSLLAKTKVAQREKTPTVTAKDVDVVLQMGELNEEFFKELVKARESLGKTIRKGSADGEARPPRGKRKPSSA